MSRDSTLAGFHPGLTMMLVPLLCAASALWSGCESKQRRETAGSEPEKHRPNPLETPTVREASESRSEAEVSSPTPKAAPADPADLPPSERPQVVLLHAAWCQWCRVLEHDALPDPRVATRLRNRYVFRDVDVDDAPLWMDLPGVDGLPTLVFFDREGRHVLTRSGYREPKALAMLLEVTADRIEGGELEPYDEQPVSRLASNPMTPSEASVELERLEKQIFLKVNSNDGSALHSCPHSSLASSSPW